uniref:Uncharacterized protein n=1 Tax=Lepeophtheirus salmonis TaxID=72036 RepID=A0A0K2URC1_LEPSM
MLTVIPVFFTNNNYFGREDLSRRIYDDDDVLREC